MHNYDIEIKHHAMQRAMQRGISPDQIEHCILCGKKERHGKNYVRFTTKSVICVGEFAGATLKIITIERRKR